MSSYTCDIERQCIIEALKNRDRNILSQTADH